MREMTFQRTDVWVARGADFAVEVKHFFREPSVGSMSAPGGHHWTMYAYIYPKHPLFARLRTTGKIYELMCQGAVCDLPLHGGPTYFMVHRVDGQGDISSVQVGCDYQHLHDDMYSMAQPEKDGSPNFMIADDAKTLFNYLESMVEESKKTQPTWDASAIAAETV